MPRNKITEIKRDFSSMIAEQLRGELTKTIDVLDIPPDISMEEAVELVKRTVKFRNDLRKHIKEIKGSYA